MEQISLPVEHLDIVRAAEAIHRNRLNSPDDPIEPFFSTPIPKELWHYTNITALDGILKFNRLWATEAHFTTDISEFVHARDVAIARLRTLEPQTEDRVMAGELALKTIEEE